MFSKFCLMVFSPHKYPHSSLYLFCNFYPIISISSLLSFHTLFIFYQLIVTVIPFCSSLISIDFWHFCWYFNENKYLFYLFSQFIFDIFILFITVLVVIFKTAPYFIFNIVIFILYFLHNPVSFYFFHFVFTFFPKLYMFHL